MNKLSKFIHKVKRKPKTHEIYPSDINSFNFTFRWNVIKSTGTISLADSIGNCEDVQEKDLVKMWLHDTAIRNGCLHAYEYLFLVTKVHPFAFGSYSFFPTDHYTDHYNVDLKKISSVFSHKQPV